MRRPRFETDSVRHYEFTHGYKPKGEGLWSFTLHQPGRFTRVEHHGTFSEARAAALSEAKQLGCESVSLDT